MLMKEKIEKIKNENKMKLSNYNFSYKFLLFLSIIKTHLLQFCEKNKK